MRITYSLRHSVDGMGMRAHSHSDQCVTARAARRWRCAVKPDDDAVNPPTSSDNRRHANAGRTPRQASKTLWRSGGRKMTDGIPAGNLSAASAIPLTGSDKSSNHP